LFFIEKEQRAAAHKILRLATFAATDDNQAMSVPENELFASALSLPQAERADLAFQLLQSLTPPGEEVSSQEFGAELHARIDAHRRGEIPSFSRDEARSIIQRRLQDRTP
jgi:putative addiction module component (TIGR02574 family)